MNDLQNKEIGGFQIVLKPVPASKARKIQTTLLAVVAEPLAEALSQQGSGLDIKNMDEVAKKGQQLLAGLKGLAGILPKLNDGQLDEIINACKPFILVDGKPFDEDSQFNSKNLMTEYEIIWYFLRETFEDFFRAALLRLSQVKTAAALNQ